MSDTPPPRRRKLPLVRTALWGLVVVVSGVLLYLWTFGVQRTDGRLQAVTEPYGTAFALLDQRGETFTQDDLRGGPTAVFFGFTHCPDICPTTLYELAAHRQALQAAGEDIDIVFVTVDPERDTPDILAQYVANVGTEVTALSGEPAAVNAMLEGWGVHARRVGEDENYTMDHTASVILLGTGGQFVGTIAYGENTDTAREKLLRLAAL